MSESKSADRSPEQAAAAPAELVLVETLDELPTWAPLERLVAFLHEDMKPYEDTPRDVERGLRYALDPARPGNGFAVLAAVDEALAGAVVFLETGMGGYVPENILLFVCVRPEMRGRGLGARLIERAVDHCQGDVKLHVEYDNPAKRLYERLGFSSDYAEMRLKRDKR